MFVKLNEVLRHATGQRQTNNYNNVIHAILSGIVSCPCLFPFLFGRQCL